MSPPFPQLLRRAPEQVPRLLRTTSVPPAVSRCGRGEPVESAPGSGPGTDPSIPTPGKRRAPQLERGRTSPAQHKGNSVSEESHALPHPSRTVHRTASDLHWPRQSLRVSKKMQPLLSTPRKPSTKRRRVRFVLSIAKPTVCRRPSAFLTLRSQSRSGETRQLLLARSKRGDVSSAVRILQPWRVNIRTTQSRAKRVAHCRS